MRPRYVARRRHKCGEPSAWKRALGAPQIVARKCGRKTGAKEKRSERERARRFLSFTDSATRLKPRTDVADLSLALVVVTHASRRAFSHRQRPSTTQPVRAPNVWVARFAAVKARVSAQYRLRALDSRLVLSSPKLIVTFGALSPDRLIGGGQRTVDLQSAFGAGGRSSASF
ncbi:hypothetical protein HPB51_024244 [Rhipicephalus microplus]|uniref:Uncharacterized protein n=1 Tax=Rhipicephalus microplus TaxID=6941 RepID=A0A9J6DXY1_RHIMP|nr:hypothetical protein HPB51_024244 [Rhipicephalus microplus]